MKKLICQARNKNGEYCKRGAILLGFCETHQDYEHNLLEQKKFIEKELRRIYKFREKELKKSELKEQKKKKVHLEDPKLNAQSRDWENINKGLFYNGKTRKALELNGIVVKGDSK